MDSENGVVETMTSPLSLSSDQKHMASKAAAAGQRASSTNNNYSGERSSLIIAGA